MAEALLIYETVHGSQAYNLARPESDVDLKGVLIGPREWYFSYRGGVEQIEHNADHVHYELRKFVLLAADANPSVLELLFTDPSHHRTLTAAGERLLAHRELFVSAMVADRFGGYARAQLRRIQTHRSWLLNPPAAAPTRAQFGLPDRTVIPAEQLAAALELISQGDTKAADVSPNFLELLARERRYKGAQTQWQQYHSWLRNRNPARAALEARFGYDTKHAMHLIRLQRMAVEILDGRGVIVSRPDREELLSIRDGAWTYEQIEAASDAQQASIESAHASTALPLRPDTERIDALCIELIEDHLRSA